MTGIPGNYYEYPNMNSSFPFYMKKKQHTHVPSHRHDFLEFTLVTEGQGVEIINGVTHNMKPGTLIFLLPYQVHEIHAEPNAPLSMYVCNFDISVLNKDGRKENGMQTLVTGGRDDALPYVQAGEREFAELNRIFERMMSEFVSSQPWRIVMIKAKLFEALVLFDRMRSREQPAVHQLNSDNSSIWEVVHYVHHHYREPLTLGGLAGRFHFSPSHLSELFKGHTGQNFIDFLHELRIRHACSLLQSTEMSVSDIAMEVGFGSFQSFSRSFRKIKRMTPTEYKATRRML